MDVLFANALLYSAGISLNGNYSMDSLDRNYAHGHSAMFARGILAVRIWMKQAFPVIFVFHRLGKSSLEQVCIFRS